MRSGIYDWADLTNKAGQMNDSPIIDISVSVGAGLVLTTIAGALLVAAAIGLFWLPKPSPSAAATPDEQSSLDGIGSEQPPAQLSEEDDPL